MEVPKCLELECLVPVRPKTSVKLSFSTTEKALEELKMSTDK